MAQEWQGLLELWHVRVQDSNDEEEEGEEFVDHSYQKHAPEEHGQELAEITPPSTKLSLQCEVLNCNFRTPLLRNSKARQSWYNHQYSHNDDRFRDSMRDYMEEETGEDTFEDVDEQIDDEPNSITVTGEESWMRNYGLTERLPWPQDEVADGNSSQTNRDTPLSSLDVSVIGDRGDIEEFEYNHSETTVGEMVGDVVMIDTGHSNVYELAQAKRCYIVEGLANNMVDPGQYRGCQF